MWLDMHERIDIENSVYIPLNNRIRTLVTVQYWIYYENRALLHVQAVLLDRMEIENVLIYESITFVKWDGTREQRGEKTMQSNKEASFAI